MMRLFDLGNRYVKESDWKTIAVLKFCLISFGILIGMLIPKKKRKCTALVCTGIFAVTYLPLMYKLLRLAKNSRSQLKTGGQAVR